MTKLALSLIFTAVCAPSFAADPAAALALAKANSCFACHSIDKKMVGPAWSDIGKKYAAEAGAEDKLIGKVRTGGKGNWGPIAMPPNIVVKDADLKVMVQYILTLK